MNELEALNATHTLDAPDVTRHWQDVVKLNITKVRAVAIAAGMLVAGLSVDYGESQPVPFESYFMGESSDYESPESTTQAARSTSRPEENVEHVEFTIHADYEADYMVTSGAPFVKGIDALFNYHAEDILAAIDEGRQIEIIGTASAGDDDIGPGLQDPDALNAQGLNNERLARQRAEVTKLVFASKAQEVLGLNVDESEILLSGKEDSWTDKEVETGWHIANRLGIYGDTAVDEVVDIFNRLPKQRGEWFLPEEIEFLTSKTIAMQGVTIRFPVVSQEVVASVSVADTKEERASSIPQSGQWFNTEDKEVVVAAFNEMKGVANTDLDWTGNAEECEAGESSAQDKTQLLQVVTYYRAMAGVTATVKENFEYSAMAQEAALMMSTEGVLTHTPKKDVFECYTQDGARAAANSNLYLGRVGVEAVHGYMEDPGEGNIDVGHRYTILHPPTREMGVGQVDGSGERYPSNALWVFDDEVFEEALVREPEGFVAWPPRGFVPEQIAFYRWSFAKKLAEMDNARVTMENEHGDVVPLKIIHKATKGGEVPGSVIVWEPQMPELSDNTLNLDGGGRKLNGDHAFKITVHDVVVGEVTRDYSYDVTIIGAGSD